MMRKRAKQPDSRRLTQPASATRESIRAMLRDTGLRTTTSRVAVLRRLLEASGPLSHAEMVELLQNEDFDPATVYRNLKDLSDAGLVARRDLGDHTWRFELVRAGSETHGRAHPHFLCEDCGTVACLDSSRVAIAAGPGAPRAIGKGGVEIQVKGRCDRCA